jgi:hypothetical protein
VLAAGFSGRRAAVELADEGVINIGLMRMVFVELADEGVIHN